MGRKGWQKGVVSGCLAVLLGFSAVDGLAAPASGRTEVLLQPTGQKLTAALRGDERFNWRTAATGEVILQDRSGYWHFATFGKKGLTPSGARYGIDLRPSTAVDEAQLLSWRAAQLAAGSTAPLAVAPLAASAPTTVPMQMQPTLLLLVDFSDIQISTPESGWAHWLAAPTDSALNSYFSEVSAGKMGLSPAAETQGATNDGVVRVQLSDVHPNTGSQILRDNQTIVRNALSAADPYVDFSTFDRDGNGYLSGEELHLVVIVAGYEAAYGIGSPSVWAHWWTLDATLFLDGKGIANPIFGGGYIQAGELHGDHPATIGVVAHELGHDLGLPDMYDYDGSSLGIGIHSLMANGCWGYTPGSLLGSSPTHLDPWSKVRKGFVAPLTAAAGDYLLDSIATGSYGVLKIPTPDPNQYFLLENRQLAGFDQALAMQGVNGGVAIWHIDETVIAQRANTGINNDEKHKGIDLEEANESVLGYSQLDSRLVGGYHHYYSLGGSWRFAADTLPDSDLYDGSPSGGAVEVPVASSPTMQVRVFTDGDADPPLVSSSVPGAGASNVPPEQTITLTFNEEVAPGPTFSSISLAAGGAAVPIATNLAGPTLTIDPLVLLSRATTYTVTVPAGALVDRAGNALTSPVSFKFTTSRRK